MTDRPETGDNYLLIRQLLKTATEPVLVLWDPSGIITGWYMGAEKTFGWSAFEALGKSASILYTPEDLAMGIPQYEIDGALKRGYSENDRWMLRKDGARFWANGILSPILSDTGQLMGFGKILRDRTDSRTQVESLERLIENLRQGGAAKALSISTVAHELRGPLSAISNAVNVLQLAYSKTELGTAALEIIARQCHSMTRLVDDLLDASRLQIGKVQVQKRRLALGDVAGAAIETCHASISQRQQHLDVISQAGPVLVDGDFDRLRQVFVNLIQNASKFTPEGGNIWVKVSSEGHEAVIHVEDNGCGIAPHLLPRIFDMFTQAEDVASPRQGGLGLGLSIVKEIVALHGGTIQVRSDGVGLGAEFTVRLPAVTE